MNHKIIVIFALFYLIAISFAQNSSTSSAATVPTRPPTTTTTTTTTSPASSTTSTATVPRNLGADNAGYENLEQALTGDLSGDFTFNDELSNDEAILLGRKANL